MTSESIKAKQLLLGNSCNNCYFCSKTTMTMSGKDDVKTNYYCSLNGDDIEMDNVKGICKHWWSF